MITTATLIALAQSARADGGDINPVCRVFVCRLLGEIRDTSGQAAHDDLARAIGLDHMVGNNAERWAHLRQPNTPEAHALLARTEDWKLHSPVAAKPRKS